MQKSPLLKTFFATRYVTPLREGGSLPAIVEVETGAQFVMKFVGAGQGPKALIAELIAGELGQALGLPVPQVALIELDATLGRSEPDVEICDLLDASVGLNLGLRYLPNSLNFDPLADEISAELASDIVWFDAYITNVDRTVRNVNMLIHDEELWLIDHGAALYFHHVWGDYIAQSQSRFAMIGQHVLLPFASDIDASNAKMVALINEALLTRICAAIPEDWLLFDSPFDDPEAHRAAYVAYLLSRLDAAHIFVEEAQNAAQNARAKLG